MLTWYLVSIFWCLISIACRVSQWSYANTIETAVLLVILYDILWHRWNAIREVKRDEQAERRAIEREEALEQRQIRRERQEILRKHWQELQSNLISLHRVASQMAQHRRFIKENNDSQDATIKHVMLMMVNRLPDVIAEFGDLWGRAVAQLNVFPQPRDVLALETLTVIEELGKSVGDSNIEVKDETLLTLAELSRKVSDPGTLPNLD
jgi:uncharacterized protein (DUF58 family)